MKLKFERKKGTSGVWVYHKDGSLIRAGNGKYTSIQFSWGNLLRLRTIKWLLSPSYRT